MGNKKNKQTKFNMESLACQKLFKQSGVTGYKNAVPVITLLGWVMAAATLYSYYMAWNTAQGSAALVWGLMLKAHCVVMGLVVVEMSFTTGFFWPLAMAITGIGSTITFMLAAMTGAAFVNQKGENLNDHQWYCIQSLTVACMSNAMMLSMLWEHFHRCGYQALITANKVK